MHEVKIQTKSKQRNKFIITFYLQTKKKASSIFQEEAF